jgi:hypothetical protein
MEVNRANGRLSEGGVSFEPEVAQRAFRGQPSMLVATTAEVIRIIIRVGSIEI